MGNGVMGESIYEQDFLGFSYGFRPGRGQHQALDALSVAITSKRVNWILDADIAGFFDAIDHEWMIKFLGHRIGDRRILRLIRKRSQKGRQRWTWARMQRLAERYLPRPRILHPYPNQRFRARLKAEAV